MKYRDLLNYCKEQPGLLASTADKNKRTQAKYMKWVETVDNEHKQGETTQGKKA